jgi:hypothetical protein
LKSFAREKKEKNKMNIFRPKGLFSLRKRKKDGGRIISILILSFLFLASSQERKEEGVLYIYFREEKVGFEEFSWRSDELGYILEASGQMAKPVPMEISQLVLHLDKSFIPWKFYFKGSVRGVNQEITSSLSEGDVRNIIRVSGQERGAEAKIKRDAFLLPNAIFSPYLVLTKRFRCSLEENIELSAYIIPQLEVPFTLEPKEDSPCCLIMHLSGREIEIETDEEGNLKSVVIPSQRLRVTQSLSR